MSSKRPSHDFTDWPWPRPWPPVSTPQAVLVPPPLVVPPPLEVVTVPTAAGFQSCASVPLHS